MEKKEIKNRRYAFEWFMREEDKRYWVKTKKLVEKEKKKITAFIFSYAAFSLVIIAICFFVPLRRYRQQ